MQDHSHRLLFLGLTGLMSIAALYGSEAGPTLLLGSDGTQPALSANLTRSEAKLSPQTQNCAGTARDLSALCAGTSKIALSSP